jgi:two-component system response regulator HydG
VDVRIIAASLRPLEEEIAAGRFREDLYFRINTVAIHVPPLRERHEDVRLLAESFLREFLAERAKPIEGFSREAMDLLEHYSWPGNVRELHNAVERGVLFCRGSQITVEELPASLRAGGKGGAAPLDKKNVISLQQASAEAEIETIRAALSACGGRRAEAAELLGISRKTLWEKVKQYQISFD